MTPTEAFTLTAAAGLILTGLVHSIGGEIYLLRPMFRKRGNRVLEHPLARMVLRFAWHLTMLTWGLLAAILVTSTWRPEAIGQVAFLGTGGVFVAAGLVDLVWSRGRHIGWPLLTGTGVLALCAGFPG